MDPFVPTIRPQEYRHKLDRSPVTRFKRGIIVVERQVRDLNSRRARVVDADKNSFKVFASRRIGKQVDEAERSAIHSGTVHSPAVINGESGWMGFVKMSFTQNVVVVALRLKRAGTDADD